MAKTTDARKVSRCLGRRTIPRTLIVDKAMGFVTAHADEHLNMETLVDAVGVSERTLRTAFYTQFGMAPIRYLRHRRLTHVYQSLRDSNNLETTVSEIAARFGFFEFGRFARDYQLIFGECPSETLRQRY